MNIFCPSGHLVLNAEVCPKCGWQRPPDGEIGKPVWPPVDLRSGLGGEGLDQVGTLVCAEETLVAALRSNELAGISLKNGAQRWRDALPVGQQVVSLVTDGDRVIVVLRDERSIMDGCENGSLHLLDPKTGKMKLFWQAPGHDLTAPIFIGGRILIRTTESAIYALDRKDPGRVLWRSPVDTWWAKDMLLYKDLLVLADGRAMFGDGILRALRITDGKEMWQCKLGGGLPGKQMSQDGQYIYVVDGKKDLLIIDGDTGQITNKESYIRIYSPPRVGDEFVFLVVCGNKDSHAEDHYLLLAMQRGTGEVVWQAPLPERVTIAPEPSRGLVLLGGAKGTLFAFQAENGRPIWTNLLGSEVDPLHTRLLECGDQISAGTYYGRLALITIRQREVSTNDIQHYLDQEEWSQAAAVYAMNGRYADAARLFAEKLDEPKKALQLLEKGELFDQAARLAFERRMYSEALENYRKGNDLVGQAETLLAMGDDEGAAALFVQLGDPKRAAELLENAGKLRQAKELYQKAGLLKESTRLLLKIGFTSPSDIEEARRMGKFDAAARYEMQNGLYEEAAKDFNQANLPEEELQALQRAVESGMAETWIWQRMAEIGEHLGKLETAADAWLKLERPEKAGAAYRQVAETLMKNHPESETAIAKVFEKAVEAFNLGGYEKEELDCKEMVQRFRHLPRIVIQSLQTNEGFREGEWNCLTLVVKNIGYGLARKVFFKIGGDRFEVEENSEEFRFNLAMGVDRALMIRLKPLAGQVGDVPLQISGNWLGCDPSDEVRDSVPVRVAYKEAPKSATPITYIVEHVDKIVHGQSVDGDYVSEGSQKGDRVEIHRSTGTVTNNDLVGEVSQEGNREGVYFSDPLMESDGAQNLEKTCPHCKEVIPLNAKVCVYCGKSLSGEDAVGELED